MFYQEHLFAAIGAQNGQNGILSIGFRPADHSLQGKNYRIIDLKGLIPFNLANSNR